MAGYADSSAAGRATFRRARDQGVGTGTTQVLPRVENADQGARGLDLGCGARDVLPENLRVPQTSAKPLRGKAALVTGAAQGIGLAISERLLSDGASVALIDIDGARVRREGDRLSRLGYQALGLEADITDPAEVDQMVKAILDRWGRVDVVINNAGITGPAKPVWAYSPEEWVRVITVDLVGVFLCCRAAVPIMLRQGGGKIVNIASIAGKEGNPNMSAYSSAKAGVIGFTKALAKEVAEKDICVNCVTPAVIETDILKQLNDEAVGYMVSKIPMGRVGRPEEVASLVAWLATDECSFTTGAVFDISGGRATY